MKEYTNPHVLLRFVPGRPGIQRAHIDILNSRHVWCGLTARNIQRALGLPEEPDDYCEVELVLRRTP